MSGEDNGNRVVAPRWMYGAYAYRLTCNHLTLVAPWDYLTSEVIGAMITCDVCADTRRAVLLVDEA